MFLSFQSTAFAGNTAGEKQLQELPLHHLVQAFKDAAKKKTGEDASLLSFWFDVTTTNSTSQAYLISPGYFFYIQSFSVLGKDPPTVDTDHFIIETYLPYAACGQKRFPIEQICGWDNMGTWPKKAVPIALQRWKIDVSDLKKIFPVQADCGDGPTWELNDPAHVKHISPNDFARQIENAKLPDDEPIFIAFCSKMKDGMIFCSQVAVDGANGEIIAKINMKPHPIPPPIRDPIGIAPVQRR